MFVTEGRKELFKAISAAQGEFTTVEKGKDNPFFKSKYAPLDSIIEMVRPILAKHGLSVIQFTDIPEAGNGVIVETVITHSSGEYISGRLLMPVTKVDPQGAGSALTYGRRYGLAAALGIVSDEDVDGNQPEQGKPQKQQQAAKPAAQHVKLTENQAKYFPRVKAALDTLFGTDVAAKKKEISALTTFEGKDKKTVAGVEDYRTLDGKRLEILCHKLEQQTSGPEMCNECRKPDGGHSDSCPNATPPTSE